jgi:aromatic-L-amino-acid decarboxylase
VAYCTAQSHSSVEKAAGIAGIGREMLRKIPTDATFSMDADALAAAITADRAAGLTPFFVCATVGSTSSMAIDPVPAIGVICQREGLWLHVDAAMAGVAALVPEFRFVNAGLDFADSYCTNPHKWMGVQFDCDLFWVRDRQLLINALSILPEYLKTAAGQAGTVIDYRDWGVPLGRRFRALKLWFTLRLDGVEAIQEMMRRHVALAAEVEHWVNNDPRFVLAAPVRLNLVCFRHVDGDAATDALITNANETGEVLFTRTVLDGRSVLRFSIGTHTTQRHHVAEAWALLESLA